MATPIPFAVAHAESSQPPVFDEETQTWMLTRLGDVQLALREPSLRQADVEGQDVDTRGVPDFHETLADLEVATARFNSAEWSARLALDARYALNLAAGPAPIDLVSRVILPWCIHTCTQSAPVAPALRRRLAVTLYGRHSLDKHAKHASTARALKDHAERRCTIAQTRLERWMSSGELGISRSLLISLSETLPSFIAKAWLALLDHPDQMALLREQPHRLPAAVEELLRYGGIVRCLMRLAAKDIVLGEARIRAGQHVALRLDLANRDSSRFGSPLRLDITRKAAGMLSLGAGVHACPGASMVRVVLAAITPAFLAAEPEPIPDQPVRWHEDAVTTWPIGIPVRLRRQPRNHP